MLHPFCFKTVPYQADPSEIRAISGDLQPVCGYDSDHGKIPPGAGGEFCNPDRGKPASGKIIDRTLRLPVRDRTQTGYPQKLSLGYQRYACLPR